MTNSEHLEIHLKLRHSKYYIYSITNNDVMAMHIVLKNKNISEQPSDAINQLNWVLNNFNYQSL